VKVHLEYICSFLVFLNMFPQQAASVTDLSVFSESGIGRWAVNCYCNSICLLTDCHDGPYSWWEYTGAGVE